MFTSVTPRGTMIAQEWMINMNSFLIIFLVVWVSHLVSRMRRVHSIFIGITIASLGLLAAGFTTSGVACIFGIWCFSIGEMLSSPKMNDYLGVIAPEGQKALYMGYANMPTAIGWAYGSLLAGDLYDKMGDKANLALRYLGEHGGSAAGVARDRRHGRGAAAHHRARRGEGHARCCGTPTSPSASGIRSRPSASPPPSASSSTHAGRGNTRARTFDAGSDATARPGPPGRAACFGTGNLHDPARVHSLVAGDRGRATIERLSFALIGPPRRS